jgi:hypothetical protein
MPAGEGIVLSPEGRRAAYPDEESVLIYDGEAFAATDIPGDLSNFRLYWGGLEWRANAAPDQSCSIG